MSVDDLENKDGVANGRKKGCKTQAWSINSLWSTGSALTCESREEIDVAGFSQEDKSTVTPRLQVCPGWVHQMDSGWISA